MREGGGMANRVLVRTKIIYTISIGRKILSS